MTKETVYPDDISIDPGQTHCDSRPRSPTPGSPARTESQARSHHAAGRADHPERLRRRRHAHRAASTSTATCSGSRTSTASSICNKYDVVTGDLDPKHPRR